MDNNENRTDLLPTGNDRQIQLVVNNSQDEGGIDLGNVLYNMRLKTRIFAWVLVLCLVVGICAPMLLYQFSKSPLTVSSVVTLRYEVKGEPVTTLTAPDGTALDVNQITSSYVLQTALESMNLPADVNVGSVRSNIRIQTVLTDESRRTKEALAGLAEAKNADAYKQLQTAEMVYQNRFVVSLTNGFREDEDDKTVREITDAELKLLLDRILTAYNDYLVRTYADIKLPDDTFSIIDIEGQDVLDSLDQLRDGINVLYKYCRAKTSTVRNYRSWQTGRNLTDWMETLRTFKSINIDYLYAMVSENAITRDKDALMTSWKYMLRMKQNELDQLNESIAETEKLLAGYKNDEVFISMQESDAAKSTKISTAYYNNLILQQNDYYDQAMELRADIADYTERITRMDTAKQTDVTAAVEEELARSLSSAQAMYGAIRSHMEEVFESPTYTTFVDRSAAQGKEQSFLTANIKKMVIGVVLFLIVGCGLWFLAGLAPELSKGRKATETGKEAAAK